MNSETEGVIRKAVHSLFMRDRIVSLFEEKVESQYPTPPTINLLREQQATFTDAYGVKFTEMVRTIAGCINGPSLAFVEEHISNLQDILAQHENPCLKGHTWEQVEDGTLLCFECDARTADRDQKENK